MERMIVFGANGLLGQNLIRHFKGKFDIVATSRSTQNNLQDSSIPYYSLDITSRGAVADFVHQIKPQIIVNAAAYTNVDACEDEPELCWNVNLRGVENIVEAALPLKALMIHVSTDYVFDGEMGPYSEKDLPNPRGNYARSKLAGENVVRNSDLEYIIVRTQVLFGVGNNVRPNFVTWVVDQLTQKKIIRIVDDQIGSPTYAPDFCEALERLIQKQAFGLFHVSGPDILSRYDFAIKIANVFDLDKSLIERIKTEELNQKAPRPMNSAFKIFKLINYTGWEPHSLDQALHLMKKELSK